MRSAQWVCDLLGWQDRPCDEVMVTRTRNAWSCGIESAIQPKRLSMRRCLLLCGIALAVPALAEQPARPVQLGLCSACHGEDGRGRSAGIPHLAGQDETYLIEALRQYRSGARSAAAMRAVSGSLLDRDIEALSRWYANQGSAR